MKKILYKLIALVGIISIGFYLVSPFGAYADTQTIGAEGSSIVHEYGMSSAIVWSAQPFEATVTGELLSVEISNKFDVGTPTDGVFISLYSDNAGTVGTWIADSNSHPASEMNGSTCTKLTYTFDSGSLTSGTSYWLVYDRTGTRDDSNFYANCGTYGYTPLAARFYNGLGGSWHYADYNAGYNLITVGTRGGTVVNVKPPDIIIFE